MGRVKGTPNKKRKAKDPNKPKRPTSAYFYFAASKREEAAHAGKKISRVAEWTKQISAIWREMTSDDKVPFDKLAVVDKKRFDEAMAEYKGKDANKPKRPQSAYFLWLADFRKEQKPNFSENKELLRAAGVAWKKLSTNEKIPYEEAAKIEKKKYDVLMKEYAASGGFKAKRAKVDAPAKNGHSEEEEEDDAEDDDDEEEEEEEEDDE